MAPQVIVTPRALWSFWSLFIKFFVGSLFLPGPFNLTSLVLSTMRIINHNPHNLTAPFRAQLISEELKNIDVIILNGTMRRTTVEKQAITITHPHHFEISLGWTPTRFSNRSCGVSFFFNKRNSRRKTSRQSKRHLNRLRGESG